jgi:hypothetical protein
MITMMSAEERQRFWELCKTFKPAREAIKRATVAKPEMVDIPFAKLTAEPEVRRCCRLLTDGRQCESPAVEGDECLRHFRWYTLYLSVHGLPLPEDGLSLQEVLAFTVDLVLSKQATPEQAHAVAELCRVMEKNMTRCERELEAMGRRHRR